MKFFLPLLLSLLFGRAVCAQEISYENFKSVIPLLQKEDFKAAFEKTSELLQAAPNDSSNLHGIILYMNIYSAAGLVTKDQMTAKDFSENANKYIGQRIVMSAHPCIDSSAHGYNSLQFGTHFDKFQGMTISANNTGTNILCFEYFDYKDPISPADYIGKNVRCGGILTSVETSESKIWISRLHVSYAFARISNPR
jgi:hypothetical protein